MLVVFWKDYSEQQTIGDWIMFLWSFVRKCGV